MADSATAAAVLSAVGGMFDSAWTIVGAIAGIVTTAYGAGKWVLHLRDKAAKRNHMIRTHAAEIEELKTALAATVTTLSQVKDVGKLVTEIGNIQSAMEELQSSLDEAERKSAEISGIRKALTSHDGDQARTSEALNSLRSDVAKAIEMAGFVKQSLTAVHLTSVRVEENVSRLANAGSAVEARLKSLEEARPRMESTVQQHGERIASLEARAPGKR
jgi:chromosome segregation ATPase